MDTVMSESTTLVVLAEYNTLMEAEITKSILDSAGIESFIRNELMSTVYPLGIVPAQIVVRQEDQQRADELLHCR